MSQTMGRIRRILIWINISIAIFGVIFIGGSMVSRTDYNKNLKIGMQYEGSKSYEDAYRQFKRLAGKYPEEPEVLLHYAEACYQCGKLGEMQEALIRMKKYRGEKSTSEEYKKFEEKLLKEIVPDQELGKIITEMKGQNTSVNVATLTDYTARKPADFMGFYLLGNLYMEQEEYLKAIDAYENVIRLKEGMIPALLNLASAYRHIGYYSKAEYTASRTFAYNPGSAQAFMVMARVRLDMYDDKKAVEYARRATQLDPMNLDAKAMLAAISYYAGSQNESLQILAELKKKKYFDVKSLEGILSGKIQLRK